VEKLTVCEENWHKFRRAARAILPTVLEFNHQHNAMDLLRPLLEEFEFNRDQAFTLLQEIYEPRMDILATDSRFEVAWNSSWDFGFRSSFKELESMLSEQRAR
jgi:hypothetical protein